MSIEVAAIEDEDMEFLSDVVVFVSNTARVARCEYCGCYSDDVERHHRNTAYCKEQDESNYMTACGECHKRDHEDMQALWDDYYASRI